MFWNHRLIRVFVYREMIDMRAGFERLSYLVREEMKSNLLEGHIYLFMGKNRRRAKALLFDGTGLLLIHKRLETGRFMRFEKIREKGEITTAELALILDGANMEKQIVPMEYLKAS